MNSTVTFGNHTPESVAHFHELGNEQHKFKFANGYGASVIRGPYTYGGPEGLFELAVLGLDGHLTYDTPITDDVIGYLDAVEVEEKLDAIAALPAP